MAFEDALPEFGDMDVRVFGVSPDEPKRQARFRDKHRITFPLLCDTEQTVAARFGCWVEKRLYGKTHMGIERSTFLVGSDGRVLRVWRKVKVKGHVEEVRAAAEELL